VCHWFVCYRHRSKDGPGHPKRATCWPAAEARRHQSAGSTCRAGSHCPPPAPMPKLRRTVMMDRVFSPINHPLPCGRSNRRNKHPLAQLTTLQTKVYMTGGINGPACAAPTRGQFREEARRSQSWVSWAFLHQVFFVPAPAGKFLPTGINCRIEGAQALSNKNYYDLSASPRFRLSAAWVVPWCSNGVPTKLSWPGKSIKARRRLFGIRTPPEQTKAEAGKKFAGWQTLPPHHHGGSVLASLMSTEPVLNAPQSGHSCQCTKSSHADGRSDGTIEIRPRMCSWAVSYDHPAWWLAARRPSPSWCG